MEKLFSIGQAAKKAGITAEALRHYDRIGLVHPHRIDPWTGYRYYSEADIVRLHAVCALRCMDISLEEIKSVLALVDVDKILLFLKQAEQSAEEKISQWQEVKKRVQRAKRYYENKAAERPQKEGAFIQELPQRVILLSDRLTIPAVDNLWDYHRHFYEQLGEKKKKDFSFADIAGIYEAEGQPRLFAICTRYSEADGLLVLPAGKYLCADCAEKQRESVLDKLCAQAKDRYSSSPAFTVSLIMLSGILQWDYQIQVPLDADGALQK